MSLPKDTSEAQTSDNRSPRVYNARALVRCEATYLGAALPTKTTQPPGIIHEPLEKICEKENLPSLVNTPKKPVRLYIFHSGIMIELLFGKHNGELVWYPIQNLYCSAGLQPLKTKHGPIEFKTLDDKAAGKSSLKPIFAIVVRETVQKKVLQCHAFAITRKEIAQLLVQATALAYRDENGWNQPLNNLHFGNTEYGHTLNIADEIHTDSGYSDHEESSLKGGQSPRSSDLSTSDNYASGQNSDNQKSQKAVVINHSSASAPPSIAGNSNTDEKLASNKTHNAPQSPHASSQASVTFSGFQSDLFSGHSADELDSSTISNKSVSMSSGYPLSRDSSLATGNEDITPTATIIHRVKRPLSASRQHATNRTVPHWNASKLNMAPLESFRSLSLNQSTINSRASDDRRFQPIRMSPTVEVINVDGVPRRVVHHQTPHSTILPTDYYNSGRMMDRYYYQHKQPVYTQYHPDQFMYRPDHYATNGSSTDSKLSWSKSAKKNSKNGKVQKISGSPARVSESAARKLDVYNNRHTSMEGRLTKKSIPRQLL